MSISNIGSTQTPPIGGLLAPRHNHHKNPPGQPPAASKASTGSPTAAADSLASAVAAALTQLGLTPGSNSLAATNSRSPASLPQQSKAARQVQQYKDIASTNSNLSRALSSSTSSTSSNPSGAGDLTTVFQS